MNKQINVWSLIQSSLQDKVPVMLLYVLESSGSSPGRQGFSMAVNSDGFMEGSIGGGIMEHKFVEMAKDRLKAESLKLKAEVRKQIHDKAVAKDQSGMICSGEQTIFLYPAQVKDLSHVIAIIDCLQANDNGLLTLSNNGIYFTKEAEPYFNYHYHFINEENWQYEERVGYKNKLFIIGGGHCALAFSKLMRSMDFYIHLFDDRENLNTFLQNEYVHEKAILNDYTQLKELLPSGDNHYVVIMTFGYRTDDIALRSLLHKKFKYIGVMGSRKKMEKLFNELQNDGISDEVLGKIYTPIGIQIKSQTPEEIAVSIAAEIIQVKNEKS